MKMNTEEYCETMLARAEEKAKLLPEVPGASKEQTIGMIKSMYTPADGMITVSLPQLIWDTIELMRADIEDGQRRTANVIEEGIIGIIEIVLKNNPLLNLAVAVETAKRFAIANEDGVVVSGELKEIEFDS
jgi:hypothetical protein